jgi:hypothetical protein
MTRSIRPLALATILAAAFPAWADDAPKPPDAPKDAPKPPVGSSVLNPNPAAPTHSAGTITGKLSKSSDGTVTLMLPQLDRKSTGGRRGGAQLRETEKGHDYELAAEAKVRWHDLPKKPDGKPYTDQEYQAIRDAAGGIGYKADKSDLKPGQTVRLYLGKAGKDDKPVVTRIVIVADAPKHDDSKDADKAKKKN